MLTLDLVQTDNFTWTDAARSLVREICDSTEPEVRALLPALADDVTIHVRAASGPFEVIPQTGDGGASVSPGHVSWSFDPSRPGGLEAVARARLRPTLFHELHHQVRGWVLSDTATFAQQPFVFAAVAEGLATAFERDASGVAPPWADYPDDADAWVRELVALPIGAPYPQWMFMHPDGRLWIGYRAGTFLADRAMRESGRTAADLVTTPADEILALAGYEV